MIRERKGKDIFGFSIGMGFGELFTTLLTALLNYYYVRTMGLSNWWFLVGQTIFAVYNAFNDPIIGYFTNKKFRFSEKWGKNFPWIMFGGIGCLVFMVLLYAVPFRKELGLFAWMLVMLCLSDTLFSMFQVNLQGLSPTLFPKPDQRRGLGVYSTLIGTVSMLLGFIVPEFGDISSPTGYLKPMFIGAGIGLIMLALLRPSVKEEPELTEKLFANVKGEQNKQGGFFSVLAASFKHRNFLFFIILYLGFSTLSNTTIASLPYFIEFVLRVPTAKINSLKTMMILIEFVGVFASIPLWSIVAKKRGFKFTAVASIAAIIAFATPLYFVNSIIVCYVVFFLIGVGVGGFWVMIMPLFSDTVDEITADVGVHQEGILVGIKTFFSRFALIFQALIYWAIRTATGFSAQTMQGSEITDGMKFGIRFEMIGVSSLILLAATIIFALRYDLDADKMAIIRKRLDNPHQDAGAQG